MLGDMGEITQSGEDSLPSIHMATIHSLFIKTEAKALYIYKSKCGGSCPLIINHPCHG